MSTIEGIRLIKEHLPGVHTTLGLSNISLRPQPGRPPRPQLGVPPRVPPGRPRLRHRARRPHHAAGPDPRGAEAGLPRPHLRPPPRPSRRATPTTTTRSRSSSSMFEGVTASTRREGGPLRLADRAAPLARASSTATATASSPTSTRRWPRAHGPLAIINDVLLEGMKVVGDLFGTGEMQLPFVLQSAETMKAAVAYLEPHMDKVEGESTQGPHRARHREGRRPRHRQEPRRHHPHEQRLRGAQPRHQGQRHRDGRQGRRGEGRRHRHERPAREEHADHAREPRGAEHPRPGRHPGAARRRRPHPRLRRARPARGLRGPALLRQGRLRGPPRHGPHRRGEARRRPTTTPTGAACRSTPRSSSAAASPSRRRRRGAGRPPRPLARGRHRQPGLHAAVPRHRRWSRASPLDDIAAFINETALFRNQWQFRPEKGENDEDFKDRIRPQLREELAKAKAAGLLVPAGRLRLLPGQRRRRRPRDLDRRDPHRRAGPLPLPPPAQGPVPLHRRLLQAGRRPTRSTTPPSTSSRWARPCPRPPPSCSPTTGTRSTCSSTASASRWPRRCAELWHQRIREEWGFADEDGPALAGLFRQQYRGGRYSWGYPACPDLEDNVTILELLDGERIGLECSEETGFQYQPEQTTSRAHLPPPAGEVLRRPVDARARRRGGLACRGRPRSPSASRRWSQKRRKPPSHSSTSRSGAGLEGVEPAGALGPHARRSRSPGGP